MSATGPFTVIVKRRRVALGPIAPPPGLVVVYREAFATLDKARQRVMTVVWDTPGFGSQVAFRHTLDDANQLNENGGKVSLPNGDVIEVEARTYEELWEQISARPRPASPAPGFCEKTLAAWNAEHGIGLEAGAR